MKYSILKKVLFIVLLFLSFSLKSQKEIKNIIFMIPDGTSIDVLSIARWYNNSIPLAVDRYICGLLKTHSSDAPIGDSAPTGSTFSTGHLSQSGFVATYPYKIMDGENIINTNKEKANTPLFTILEASKLLNKKTGLVFTCHFPHATPADFSAHTKNRSNYEGIAKQMVYNNMDVVIGGGQKFISPLNRTDKIDLSKILIDKKYNIVSNLKDFRNFNGEKLWALFASQDFKNDIDRDTTQEPSLAEMTNKAIKILSKNKNGFFLMVEGSKVDWSAHDNDPIGMVTEFLAFDKAVEVAINFAKNDSNTIVIICPDHGNSGISIGNWKSNNNYDKLSLKEIIQPLKNAKKTADEFRYFINESSSKNDISQFFNDNYSINNLSNFEFDSLTMYVEYLKNKKSNSNLQKPYDLTKYVASIITQRTYFGFTTNGHTGEDVFLAIYSPNNYRPTGLVSNIEINKYMCNNFDINLDSLTNLYFVPHYKVFQNCTFSLDTTSKNNAILIVKQGKNKLEIFENTNYVIYNKTKLEYSTLMIFNGTNFYVPLSLKELFDRKKVR